MDNISIESLVAINSVGVHEKLKTDMAGYNFLPPVPLALAPSEAEQKGANNTSSELVTMELHAKFYDKKNINNESMDGVYPMDVTEKASMENPGSGKGSQGGWIKEAVEEVYWEEEVYK